MSVEGFTCLLVFKNLFSFGLTFKGFDWLVEADSTKTMFIALGSVQIGICALTIPLCKLSFPSHLERSLKLIIVDMLGKKNRSFFHRHNVFFKATDWIANCTIGLFAKGASALG